MIKIRSHRKIALLLVLAMLATMFVGIGTTSAASSDNGVLTVSKSVNQNVQEEDNQSLGWVKVAIDQADRVNGNLYVEFNLPDGVEFDATTTQGTVNNVATGDTVADEDTSWTVQVPVTASDADDFYATIKLPTVRVDESAADDINVDVTVDYVDNSDESAIDSFTGSLLLGKKGNADVTVTADDPTTVSLGFGRETAEITLDEATQKSLEYGSKVSFTLPDGYKWAEVEGYTAEDYTTNWVDGGRYNLDGALTFNEDRDEMYLTITSESSALADKIKINALIDVYPDADKGDVKVAVEDISEPFTEGEVDYDPDSNVEDTDIIIATYGDSDADITADEDSGSEYAYRATEDNELWDITLESSGTFTSGDDIMLTLPEGVQFMSDYKDAEDYSVSNVTDRGLYNDKQSLWLTVSGSPEKIELQGLTFGVTPSAQTGDLKVEISGDVEGSVVAGLIVDRAAVTAAKANVQVGLDEAAGDITLVENKDKALEDQVIYLTLPSGVTFSSAPTVLVNGDEEDDVATLGSDLAGDYDDDVCAIDLTGADLDSNDPDTIVITDLKYDIDNRYTAGKEIAVKLGGKDVDHDTLNDLDDADQFEDEADDAIYTVANAVVGSANAANVVFTIGATTYTNNGVSATMDVAPYVSNGRTYVPVRYIANALGISDENIIWDAANQTVTLLKGDKVVQFKMGSTTRLINGIATTMDVAPQAVSNRTFLPARFVAEAFGATVGWDAANPNLVTINVK